ncbi:hypothetical protein DHD08_19235 [Arenibacter sp. H213]|uniref:Uncharacterized protein n=1 Tax=Arenibacter antarcticus TaxID=2040469 RepID=A0ABW5VE80_9FLAO|nr:hypothetical protein [Arenibacter sp. H213]MCM4169816.1 hypothetical protein [Arenibacter sp. H213]
MKKCILNIRVTEEFRNDLEYRVSESETNLSDYIRNILWDSLYYEEDEYFNQAHDDDVSFSKSFKFTFLTAWLFTKYMYPVEHNTKNVIQEIKAIVDEAIQDTTLSNALRYELSKVTYDINRFLNEPNYLDKQFQFPIPNHQGSFDYTVLFNEVWTIYYR